MTEQTPLADPTNTLLAAQQCGLTMGRIHAEDGTELAVMTIRTPSTTLTVMLPYEDAAAWLRTFRDTVNRMDKPVTTVPANQRQGQRRRRKPPVRK